MSDSWVVDASPVILLAKAGYLHLLDQSSSLLVPEAVAQEIEAGRDSDPARRALVAGWGIRTSPRHIPEAILEWGLGAGETSVLALVGEKPGRVAVLDDAAARKCALSLGIPLIGTLAIVLRAKKAGLIPSVSGVVAALVRSGLRLDERTLRTALEQGVGEMWPPSLPA